VTRFHCRLIRIGLKMELKGYSPADVIRTLGPEIPQSALFTTFTFSPGTFQQQYLTPLVRHGCSEIAVIVDPVGYAQSLFVAAAVQGIGTEYRLRQGNVRGAFHGKLALVRTRGAMVVGVGSGNLTVSGLQTNAEVGCLYVVTLPEPLAEIDRLCQRLRGMAGMNEAELLPCGPIQLTERSRLLTSLDASILDQVDIPSDVRRIEIVSPFYDAALEALAELRGLWPQAHVRLRLDPAFGALSDRLLNAAGDNVEILVPTTETDDGRRPPVHGKLICLVGEDSATVLLGSANLSRPAMMSTDNFEAVVERRCGVDMVESLLTVPEIRWRPVRDTDRTQVAFESHLPVCRKLTATLKYDRLELVWSDQPRGERTLKLLVKGRCLWEARVEAETFEGRLQSAAVVIPDDVRAQIVSSCVAELQGEEGSLHRGWVDIVDLLSLPSEARRQFAVLDEIASDPTSCPADEVVKFVELLQRRLLSNSGGTWYQRAKEHTSSDQDYDDAPIPRNELLDLTPLGDDEGNRLLSHLMNRTLDGAVRDLRFFNRDDDERGVASRPQDSEGDHAKRGVATQGQRRIPLRIEEVLRQLFVQLADAIESSRTPRDLLILISQIPTCVKALAYALERWLPHRRDHDLIHQHLHRVVIACLAPGAASTVQREGAMRRLLSTPLDHQKSRPELKSGVAILEACLLLELESGRGARPDILRDMHDGLRTLGTADCRDVSDAIVELRNLQSASGGSCEAPEELRARLASVKGEVAGLRKCRAALYELIEKVNAGERSKAAMEDLIGTACGNDHSSAKANSLWQFLMTTTGRRQLVEIDSDESACPECYKTLPTAALTRLRDSTFVHQCSCGHLLVRSLDR
ncbi:MAG: hypothetical protein KDA75_03785, partial [Planctomycetaceae bacterium]|nr:hypothetical protein [Planctomycetaceae bacterium]